MIHSFSFVTPKHLLLALNLGMESDTLDEYEQPVRLVICDIEATASIKGRDELQGGQKTYAATCVLDLPPMQPYADVVDVLIRSDPAPCSPNADAVDVPFNLAPHNRLFVVNISVYPEDDIDEDGDRSEYINLALFVPPLHLVDVHCVSLSAGNYDRGGGLEHCAVRSKVGRAGEVGRVATARLQDARPPE